MREWIGPLLKYLLYAVFAACVLDRALTCQRETRRLRRECRKLRTEIAHIREQNARRERIWQALATDPFYIERRLRELYGYRRPDDEPPRPPRGRPGPRQRGSTRLALVRE